VSSAEEFVHIAANEKLNSVKISYRFIEDVRPAEAVSILAIDQELVVSPTNSAWFDSADLPDHLDPEADLAASNLRSKESYVRYNGLQRKPTLCRNIFTADVPELSEQTIDRFTDSVVESVPDALFAIDVFGGGGFHVSEKYLPTPDTTTMLRWWPGAFAQLGERFGVLQSIMIGPTTACKGIEQTFGGRVCYRELSSSDGTRRLALLRIPSDILDDPTSTDLARQWLVPRDQTTTRKPSPWELQGRGQAARDGRTTER
jgi:hypothetical protein